MTHLKYGCQSGFTSLSIIVPADMVEKRHKQSSFEHSFSANDV